MLSQPLFVFRKELSLPNCLTFSLLISSASLCSSLSKPIFLAQVPSLGPPSPAFSSTSHQCRVWKDKRFTSPTVVQFTGVPKCYMGCCNPQKLPDSPSKNQSPVHSGRTTVAAPVCCAWMKRGWLCSHRGLRKFQRDSVIA